ncbi:MAG: hypothetical protein VX278_23160 [Myxococcota bacterium]|nr:hypothetical protein [Myxococcota bacterium]
MITKKIVKLSPDMNVETINKQNVREFRPVHFGPLPTSEETETEITPQEARRQRAREERATRRGRTPTDQPPEQPQSSPNRSQRQTARAERDNRNRGKRLTPAERRQARAERRSRRGRGASPAESRTEAKKEQVAERTSNASLDVIESLLQILLSEVAHHRNQCNDTRLFRIYEKRVLGRIGNACETLKELPNTVDAQLQWVQQHLLPILNNFAQYYSKICKNLQAQTDKSYRQELEQWLFKDISDQCRQLGWFEIQQVYPYREKYDAKYHKQSRLVKVEKTLHDFVLEIRQIGTMDPESADLVQPAQIVVGVAIS